MNTVFDTIALDRNVVHWEDHLADLTPWELREGIWFKREDYFAPLGYGGPNGSKMRQLIWMMNRARAGKTHVLTGASVQSPQLSMSAIVGQHFGLPSRQVVYSKPHTVLSHPNPYIASRFGAHFEYASGPYNPILQRHMADLRQDTSLVVEYGITLDHTLHDAETVRKFHEVGAHQTQNMPPEVTKLIVPAGSCNSLTSVLLGLTRDPGNVDTLLTLGIGPNKLEWMRNRLNYIGVNTDALPFEWEHVSLHDTGYASYTDKFNGESYAGIHFHPTYEAKMWRWLKQHDPLGNVLKHDDSVGFWIVGSAPDPRVVEPYFTHTEEAA
jgi:hypothetical protein